MTPTPNQKNTVLETLNRIQKSIKQVEEDIKKEKYFFAEQGLREISNNAYGASKIINKSNN